MQSFNTTARVTEDATCSRTTLTQGLLNRNVDPNALPDFGSLVSRSSWPLGVLEAITNESVKWHFDTAIGYLPASKSQIACACQPINLRLRHPNVSSVLGFTRFSEERNHEHAATGVTTLSGVQ